MFKLLVVAMFVCFASAGLIPDLSYGSIGTVAVAPRIAIAAPAIAATSYQNNNLWSVNPVPVAVTKVAAAPIITKVAAAPIAVAASPAVSYIGGYGLGKSIGFGGIGIAGNY